MLGRYELLVPIASGGMAQVWAARLRGARQFQKIVAVKTMLPKLSEDEQFEQMFLDEASLASQIRHPNAVEILDLGEQYGILYLVMEWIEGVPLNQLMKAAKPRGGIPYPIAARIALQSCAGLHAAHELRDEKGQLVGLVHRDVSPQNLLVTYDGVTKVVDFGVAKATALGGGATVAGQVKGKVSYMAPEQVNGEGIDRRADVFALGIVLYALTTGKHPFRRESEGATMYNICSNEPVVPPSKVVPDYPAELEPIVQKALAKDRNQRYASCDEMLRALDALPNHLRVGSDGDVQQFISTLMGDKRAEQKRRIDDAITRAEEAPESGLWPGPDVQSQITGRSNFSATNSHELSGVPTGLHPNSTRNRILAGAGLIALVFSGVVLANGLSGSSEEGQEIRVIEAPEPPSDSVKAQTAASDSVEEKAATKNENSVSAEDLPTEEESEEAKEDTEAKAEPEPKPTPKPTRRAPVRRTTTKKASPAPKPAPKASPKKDSGSSQDWKYEAGF